MCDGINFQDRGTKEDIELGTQLSPKFAPDGTIPTITTDAETGEVVMFAFMNTLSLKLSIETGIMHYWSRSRNKLWRKGETSGNEQTIIEMRTDCDQDVILAKVKTQGHGASCHNGYKSCFYRKIDGIANTADQVKLKFQDEPPLFDPKEVY